MSMRLLLALTLIFALVGCSFTMLTINDSRTTTGDTLGFEALTADDSPLGNRQIKRTKNGSDF